MTTQSTPLKFCYHGQHSKPADGFKQLPGAKVKREVCAQCYQRIMEDRRQKRQLAKA
jgi:hypothetical protein